MDSSENDFTSPLPADEHIATSATPPEETTTEASAVPSQPELPAQMPDATSPALKRHSHGRIIAAAVVASLLIGGAAGATGGYLAATAANKKGTSSTSGDVRKVEVVGNSTEEVVSAAAAAAVPSVVNIAITGDSASSDGLPQDHPDVPVQGEGSGVAYKKAPDGGTYIITNNHVIDGAKKITVTDSTGEAYEGKLVGGDAESDIAVVLVQATIPTIKLGDPDQVTVGQLAVAIGSPFGLQHSVTSGVVSALHRPLTNFGGDNGEYPYIDSIQTDAAINPGNSGGALVNRNGELIGIPSIIYTDTGVSDGVGLAIPVDRATSAADQLIDKGKVDTPFLGVLGQTVTPALVTEKSLPVEEGAYIVEVTPDTEAAKAGIKPDDVVVAVDDAVVRSMDDLILAVRRHSVGDKVTLKLWRDGKETTLEMTVGSKP